MNMFLFLLCFQIYFIGFIIDFFFFFQPFKHVTVLPSGSYSFWWNFSIILLFVPLYVVFSYPLVSVKILNNMCLLIWLQQVLAVARGIF